MPSPIGAGLEPFEFCAIIYKMKFLNPLNKLRARQDKRPVILLFALLISLLAVASYILFIFWSTNAKLQYGTYESWPSHNNKLDNYTFHYPSQMDIIIPEDEFKNPTSLVKKGERGETVLIQLGTWRTEPKPDSFTNTIDRYEAASRSTRKTISKEYFTIDEREAVILTQNEEGGRYLLETFIWDNGQPRELSLQLSKQATDADRAFYESIYREILKSLTFNFDTPNINH